MSTTTIKSTSPQAPDDVVAEAPGMGASDVHRAAERARVAQREWAGAGVAVRAAALTAIAQALRARRAEATELTIREVGKPRGEAAGEVDRAIAILDYYAQACFAPLGELFPPSGPGLLYTERRPHGVAGLITPWNFPIAIPLWKAAPALCCGNAVLLKPSPDALGMAQFLERLLAAHLPEHTFTVVSGGAAAGEAVVAEADVVSFTGSVAVGKQVAAAAVGRGVPVQCEMGGQNAAIVLPDADPAAAAAMIAGAAMGYAGQKCTATRRVITVGANAAFTDALVASVKAARPGDPAQDGVTVGPVITAAARQRVSDAIATAGRDGGRVLAGGGTLDGGGWFVEPTLLDGLAPSHELLQREVFGPLATVVRTDSVDDAVRVANDVRFGLVTSIHGSDIDTLLAAAARVETGMIKVNAPSTGVAFYAPFGGEKDSSYGPREQGQAALHFYTSTRTVSLAPQRHP